MAQSTAQSKNRAGAKGKSRRPRISPVICPPEMSLEEWQKALRRQTAESENISVTPPDENSSYFTVKGVNSRQSHRVAYYGDGSPWNFCSCPDFRTSQLGTCKHIEAVTMARAGVYARRRYYMPRYSSVYVEYIGGREVKIRYGTTNTNEMRALAARFFDRNNELLPGASRHFDEFLQQAREIDPEFRCYDDAVQLIVARREAARRRQLVRGELANSDLSGLLKATLYPYQVEGVKFAFENGRTIIADEMGLGKTIQAIAAAELLRREGFVGSVLILCPTSLKYQWKREIERFTSMTAVIVEGNPVTRKQLLGGDAFYKIASYHSMANDVKHGVRPECDLIIYDEIQRLKNWDTQIARYSRFLTSDYVIALSGTPLENKLMELYSVMQLVDQYCLGPYYRFTAETTDFGNNGQVIGYHNLNVVARMLKNVLIRRRKADVALQMPSRTDTNLFVPMTREQADYHQEYSSAVSRLVSKWNRMHFLSEADRRRLLMSLSMMRMVCDSTYIIDQSSRYDTKIDEALAIVNEALESDDTKIVIFSQWERMQRIMASELKKAGVRFSFLHGSVPSAKRSELIAEFMDNPDCRVFLSTDAGATGLNLQAASLIINFDLPWNPAVLEQRIARIWRLGQSRPVQVINMIARGTIEERMLDTLKFKSNLAAGILDRGEDSVLMEGKKFEQIIDIIEPIIDNETDTETIAVVADTEPARNPDTSVSSVMADNSDDDAAGGKASAAPHHSQDDASKQAVHTPDSVVASGVSFFAGLAEMLSTPEKTVQLVNTIVKHDSATGQTSINIPVPDKSTVQAIFTGLAKLLAAEPGGMGAV